MANVYCMADFLHVDTFENVAFITIDRPKMNVLNRALQDEITNLCELLARDQQVRAVVFYGGPNNFAAGADVKEMVHWTQEQAEIEAPFLQAAFNAVADLPMPTIAAITGYALGGGLELALACDLRIASNSALVGQPEILLGIITGAGGTQRLSRLIGPARAKDLIFTGRFVAATEALSMGLVNEVVAEGELLDRALDLAKQLAARPKDAIYSAKFAIDRGLEVSLEEGLLLEQVLFAKLFGTQDQKIGMQSFIEQGPGKAKFNSPDLNA